MHQRGTTLVEVLVAAAILSLLAAGAIGIGLSSRAYAARAAVTRFDAAMTYARSIAAAGPNGATVVLSGGSLAVFSGRPSQDDALEPSGLAPSSLAGVGVAEATLGGAPLAIFVDGAGHVSMAKFAGATPPPMASEPPCPAGSQWVLTFADSRSAQQRSLSCDLPVAGPAAGP